jgi:hypothetical protein
MLQRVFLKAALHNIILFTLLRPSRLSCGLVTQTFSEAECVLSISESCSTTFFFLKKIFYFCNDFPEIHTYTHVRPMERNINAMHEVLKTLHPVGIRTDDLLILRRMRCHRVKPSGKHQKMLLKLV